MGRATYDVMRGFDADYYRSMPMHVLSTTLPAGTHPHMGRSAVTVHPNIPSLCKGLADAGAKRVYVDGGRTVQAFLTAGLLSDLTVTRVPVLLGAGIPLFGPLANPVRAQLTESRATNDGAVQSVYGFPTRSE